MARPFTGRGAPINQESFGTEMLTTAQLRELTTEAANRIVACDFGWDMFAFPLPRIFWNLSSSDLATWAEAAPNLILVEERRFPDLAGQLLRADALKFHLLAACDGRNRLVAFLAEIATNESSGEPTIGEPVALAGLENDAVWARLALRSVRMTLDAVNPHLPIRQLSLGTTASSAFAYIEVAESDWTSLGSSSADYLTICGELVYDAYRLATAPGALKQALTLIVFDQPDHSSRNAFMPWSNSVTPLASKSARVLAEVTIEDAKRPRTG